MPIISTLIIFNNEIRNFKNIDKKISRSNTMQLANRNPFPVFNYLYLQASELTKNQVGKNLLT